ncbi:MAG TPA: cytochrome P450 [Polyangiaceae bacterium]|nr:cytochrome P450 [Polyangiaceae bacterium]
MTLPPGPSQPPIVQTVQWSLRPLPFMEACARRYGDVFTLRFHQIGTFVFFTRPEHIKQIFTGDSEILLSGRANQLLAPLVGSRSVLLLDGKEHLRQRRLLMPPFHGERMLAYAAIMRDTAEAEIERMPLRAPFAIHAHMQAITLDVIMRAVFGLTSSDDPLEREGERVRRLRGLLVEFITPPPALIAFLPFAQVDLPGSPFRAFLRCRESVDRELYALIDERRRAKDLEQREDILSLMLRARDEDGQPMTDRELRDELVTMLVAGHETTATTLSWAFDQILAEPRVAKKIDAELARVLGGRRLEPAALPKLEYLDAVIKETLRMKPILPIVARELAEPIEIGGHALPAGTKIAPCIYLAHRRPEVYPEPDRFYPERFVDAKIDPYAWLPFGGSVRRCLGMAFALYEMKIILATVLSRAHLRLASGEPARIVRRGITLAPSGGTRVILTERESAAERGAPAQSAI